MTGPLCIQSSIQSTNAKPSKGGILKEFTIISKGSIDLFKIKLLISMAAVLIDLCRMPQFKWFLTYSGFDCAFTEL